MPKIFTLESVFTKRHAFLLQVFGRKQAGIHINRRFESDPGRIIAGPRGPERIGAGPRRREHGQTCLRAAGGTLTTSAPVQELVVRSGRVTGVRLRSREQVAGYLAGLDLVPPGLVTVPEWRPDPDISAPGTLIPLYAAVARKP